MSVFSIHRDQIISAQTNVVWEYFCDPHNLNHLTPADMNFEIITDSLQRMYQGQIIEYRVEFIHGLRSLWLTEIAHVREYEYFVDEQRIGPYQFWYHEHVFEDLGKSTRMVDHVTYSIGYGVIGDVLNSIWIKQRLNDIFDFRKKIILTQVATLR
jgi:ligand-binding SRPBCC domain-containing protein